MKRIALIYFITLLIGANVVVQFDGKQQVAAAEPVVIPEEAIRLRILANSNSVEDQAIKQLVRDRVNEAINEWVAELTSFAAARTVIEDHVPEIREIVAMTLDEYGVNQAYSVEFARDVSFPTKIYGNFIYPAGKYEAILISLGEAKGANWWCVLFPPLCFLDFSNGDAVQPQSAVEEDASAAESEQKVVEVKFFVVEWFEELSGLVKGLFA